MVQITIPISANIATIAAKIITANMLMASALSHPQSKKCFNKASQIISWIMTAIIPVKKAPKNVPITVPRMTIQMASVNFAFSFPTSALPESQRTGEIIIVFTIMFMTSQSKLIGKSHFTSNILHQIVGLSLYYFWKREQERVFKCGINAVMKNTQKKLLRKA